MEYRTATLTPIAAINTFFTIFAEEFLRLRVQIEHENRNDQPAQERS